MVKYPYLISEIHWSMRGVDFEKAYYLVKHCFH